MALPSRQKGNLRVVPVDGFLSIVLGKCAGQIFQPDDIIMGKNRRPLQYVLQFTDITRPWVADHGIDGPLFDADDLFVQFGTGFFQEMVSEERYRFRPAAQRRHGDGKDVEAIVEVFPEPSLLYSLFEI